MRNIRDAKRVGVLTVRIQCENTEIPKGQKSSQTHAYSLKEVEAMLAVLEKDGTCRRNGRSVDGIIPR